MASKPKVWLAKAHDLRQTATLLFQYDAEVRERLFVQRAPTRLPPFWTAGPARMLMGFALENLFKALLLLDVEKLRQVFSRDGNLSWGRDGHNLIALSKEAGFDWSKVQERYLELWQMSALWAGRYPLPVNENHLPRQRKALPTRKALIKRRMKIMDVAWEEGDPFWGAELWDLLHTGVSRLEIEIFNEIYDRCYAKLADIAAVEQ